MTNPPLQVAIVGAGNVGLALGRMLAATGDYQVRVGDCTEEACAVAAGHGIDARHLDVSSMSQLAAFLNGADIAVAAVPNKLVSYVMKAAYDRGCHYIDFSVQGVALPVFEDRLCFPGCGVSPGLADLMVAELAGKGSASLDIEVAVGAIPARRTNRLGYSLIWNLDGLYTEYTSPCEAIRDFENVEVPPLSNLSKIIIGDSEYESFCTSGIVNSVASFSQKNIRTLTCSTIRYSGHLDYMQLLLDDLGLRNRRDLLRTVLQNGLGEAEQDVVLLYATSRPADGEDHSRKIIIRIAGGSELGNALAVGSAAHAAFVIDGIAARSSPGRVAVTGTLAGMIASRFAKNVISVEYLES